MLLVIYDPASRKVVAEATALSSQTGETIRKSIYGHAGKYSGWQIVPFPDRFANEPLTPDELQYKHLTAKELKITFREP